MKIGFFLSEYPVLSETFILNELYYLQQSGVQGHVFYESHGSSRVSHPREKEIGFAKTHIFAGESLHKHPWTVLVTHALLFVRHPIRYLRGVILLTQIFNWANLRHFVLGGMLIKIIISSNVNLLYVHDAEGISLIGLFCKFFSGLPGGIIFHTFGLFSDTAFLRQKVMNYDFTLFQSKYSRQYAVEFFSVDEKIKAHMHVVSSTGVDVQFFVPRRKVAKGQTKNPTVRLVSVGRIEKMKGFDKLIHAIALLKQKHIAIQCLIVGYGSQRKTLQKLIYRLRLTDRVKLVGPMGHTDRFRALLQDADIFVLPSEVDLSGDRDMQPNAIKEAMATGCLVLTSNLGGIDEVIVSDINGFLLKSTDPRDIAHAIEEILQLSKKGKQKIQERARRTIVDNYEAQKTNALLIDVFRKYLRDDFIE